MKVVASRIECRGLDFHIHLTGDSGDEVDAVFEMEDLAALLADLRALLTVMGEMLADRDALEFERIRRLENAERVRH